MSRYVSLSGISCKKPIQKFTRNILFRVVTHNLGKFVWLFRPPPQAAVIPNVAEGSTFLRC
jgi:hypothetical protein